jgi:hypothetical protein
MARAAVSTGVTIDFAADAKHTVLVFDTPEGPVPVANPSANVSVFVGRLLDHAVKIAGARTSDSPGTELSVHPLMASHLSWARGRSDDEVLLSFRLGNLDLTLAVETFQVNGMCTQILPKLGPVRSPKPQFLTLLTHFRMVSSTTARRGARGPPDARQRHSASPSPPA